jgi:hypothetical protein
MRKLTPEELEQINPGIRHTVQVLRSWGFDTQDSGDGQTHNHECDLPHPYVHISVHPSKLTGETLRCLSLLEQHGVKFDDMPDPQVDLEGWQKHPQIEASYMPTQYHNGFIHLKNVVLNEPIQPDNQ